MSESVNRGLGISLLALMTAACGSSVGSNGNGQPGSGGAGMGPNVGTGGVPIITMGIDPGRVAIHRLNNTEYDNTVRDLLGTQSKPAAMFLAEAGLSDDIDGLYNASTAEYRDYYALLYNTNYLGNCSSLHTEPYCDSRNWCHPIALP